MAAPSLAEWERLRVEEARLEAAEELAARQEQEAFARRMRLRRMQKLLKTRGGEMLRRGLATMEELEAVEEKERKEGEEKAAAAATQAEPVMDPCANTGHDLFAAVSPSFWAELGVPGETPSDSQS